MYQVISVYIKYIFIKQSDVLVVRIHLDHKYS